MTSGRGVGIVVVSHSRPLARAALALASEMLHGRQVRIEVAAGLDETTFGTDAVRVKEAIESVDGPDGVVVLMDLGSAVLSAELALDLLEDPAARERVTLSAAPIVEGLVVAAVAASGGATRAEVAAEARNALLGKAAHLSVPGEGAPAPAVAGPAAASHSEVVGRFTVANSHGLHARPAARLVSEVSGLDATVTLTNLTTGTGPVPGGSLSRVATLGAQQGHEVEIRAGGPQAQEAVEHLLALADRHFDEALSPVKAPATVPSTTGPLPASPGIAIGPLRRLSAPTVEVEETEVGDPAAEWRRVVEAVAEVRRDIEHLRALTARQVGETEAGIFDAHLTLLADAALLGDVKQRINEGVGALSAWTVCLQAIEREWADLPDPYLRERAADVRAVGDQVRRVLAGAAAEQPAAEGILVARDLTPAQAAALDTTAVHGIVLAAGSATSHAAILARSRDIPLVVSAGRGVLGVPEGTLLVVDGGAGEVHIAPDSAIVADYRRRAFAVTERRALELAAAGEPAVTRDGTHILVAANLGSVDDARSAFAAGADAAGLVRTEFLFLGRTTPPDVAEQEEEYAAIADALGGRRATLRTLDVGGDKPLPYLPMPAEDNPFLGVRGIRLALERPALLRDQLDAICRVARRAPPTNVMFPMVSTAADLRAAHALLAEAAGPLGIPEGLRVGMMVEVPAAALKIESFLPLLDFVSIGTNDLTQYALAAERGNPGVATLSDALDPAVLQLVDHVCQAARGRVDVAVCGEVAADEAAVPLLVGLGVRELSVGPHAVPGVKARVRELDLEQCEVVAKQALLLESAEDVRQLVAGEC
ncbi:MAG: multiphosphoryl transfer protein [Nocardioidaceae bacterium]|nr:multiphosphoryl transfer protein [Nocardioidaceae bacterium]